MNTEIYTSNFWKVFCEGIIEDYFKLSNEKRDSFKKKYISILFEYNILGTKNDSLCLYKKEKVKDNLIEISINVQAIEDFEVKLEY